MSRLGQEIIQGLSEFSNDLKKGVDLKTKYNVKEVELKVPRTTYSPALVKKTRNLLRSSQPVFAEFLGVKPTTVRSWECGNSTPSEMAARFMDLIRQNPAFFQEQLQQVVTTRPEKPRTKAKPARSAKKRQA